MRISRGLHTDPGELATGTARLHGRRIWLRVAWTALALITSGLGIWLAVEARGSGHWRPSASYNTDTEPEVSVYRDIAYNDSQKLDLYPPRQARTGKAPLIIYIHGGGWEQNTKSSEPQQLALLEPMRDKGFAVASIDYSLMPERSFPAPLSDTLAAIRYLRANADRYGLDADKFGLYGFSAGGHLAALAAAIDSKNPYNNGPNEDVSSRVKAVVTLAGIFDLANNITSATSQRVDRLMNGQDRTAAQPASYLSPDDPPFMLMHGAEDQNVSLEQDLYMAELLTRAKIDHTQLLIKNANHGLDQTGAAVSPGKAAITQRMYDFYVQAFAR